MVYHGIRSQNNICSPPILRNTDVLLSNRRTKFTHFDVLLYNTNIYIYITLYNMPYHRWRPKLRFQHRFVMIVESPHETSPWISRSVLDAIHHPHGKIDTDTFSGHIHRHIQEARPQREALRYKPFLEM